MMTAERKHDTLTVLPGGTMRGQVKVPSDKSISHRSVMLGSIASGVTHVSGFLEGTDALATLAAFRRLGVSIEGPIDGLLTIHGVGLHGLCAAGEAIDVGNSGTAMRLMIGLLAGQPFDSVLTGDSSLTTRPMLRVCDPLRQMGARIRTSGDGTPPLEVDACTSKLIPLHYAMPMASAQVKSCILLAGLYADGETCVSEPAPTRNHTERMLTSFGYPLRSEGSTTCIAGGGTLRGTDIVIPGDFSSATFFMVGASITPGSDLLITNIGMNPTRTGALDVLRLMGANITLERRRNLGAEPVADIRVRHATLHGVEIPKDLVPLAIDEFPALLVAAASATGTTVLSGAAELRVKESDRIQTMADGLQAIGVQVQTHPDGMTVEGGSLQGGLVDSKGDHRIAMAFAMAALQSRDTIQIADCANVSTSFPGFVPTARAAGLDISGTND